MAWDSVPWAVGGGALHSPEVARTAIHVATGGAEGIATATDLRVVAQTVPSGSVRVLPGSFLAVSKASGGASQTYTARNPTEDVVAIAATSGSARSDLIVARIEDPFMAGEPWQDPEDPQVGPYVYTRVIPNVGAGATTHASVGTGVVLARVDIPANTGAISSAMIVDLRKVARPQRQRDLYNTQPTATSSVGGSTLVDWQTQANRSLAVPKWATQVKIIGLIGGVKASADLTGNAVVAFGSLATSQAFDLVGSSRSSLIVGDTYAVPASMRGTNQTLRLRGQRTGGTGTASIDAYSVVTWDVEFLEVASAD